jgi:type VI secretion system secreted protein Hcp
MAFDAFVKVEGVDGESQDDKHKKWIEVLSFSHGMSQPPSAVVSSAGGAGSGRVNIQDFSIVKHIDSASPKLYEACCTGKHFPSVKMELCRAGGDKLKYMEIKMSQVMVSSVRPGGSSGSGDEVPLEEVAFNFGKIEWTYVPQARGTGAGAGNIAAGWDLMLNKKV